MTKSKGRGESYAPLPSSPNDRRIHQNVVVLTHYPDYLERRRIRRLCACLALSLLILSAAVFFLFPSDPALSLARIRLNHITVHSSPELTLDLSFSLTVRVRNRDFFSLDYDSLLVKLGYRGRELGIVTSDGGGGRVRARGLSYVDATLVIDGLEVIHDVFYLIEDLAKGVVPFDTVTEVDGTVGLFFFKIPIKGSASCEVYVNTNNQSVVRQDCYPE